MGRAAWVAFQGSACQCRRCFAKRQNAIGGRSRPAVCICRYAGRCHCQFKGLAKQRFGISECSQCSVFRARCSGLASGTPAAITQPPALLQRQLGLVLTHAEDVVAELEGEVVSIDIEVAQIGIRQIKAHPRAVAGI